MYSRNVMGHLYMIRWPTIIVSDTAINLRVPRKFSLAVCDLGHRHRRWATSGHFCRSVGHLKSTRWPTNFSRKINVMIWLWATVGHLGHLFGTM